MILVVDNSYGKSIGNFPALLATLQKYGQDYKIIATMRDFQGLEKSKVKGIILSGSPLRLSRALDIDMFKTNLYCCMTFDVPILGICFGCQLLNVIHGGSVRAFGRLVRGEVKGYHFNFNDYLSEIAPGFKVKKHVMVDGRRVDCHIERGNIIGYLFHPETDMDAKKYLKRFLVLVNNKR